MKIINLSEQNSIIGRFMMELRDKNIQKDSMRFRRNIERIGEVIAYEISRVLDYKNVSIETPLAPTTVSVPADNVVIATILRAAMPLHDGIFNYFDSAGSAFISAYRKYTDATATDIDIVVEYMAAPSLEGHTLILPDPMLATGHSMELCYKALLRNGKPAKLHMAAVIASQQSLDYLQQVMPADATLWVAAVDPILNEHKYIVPGLGDAGDLCFGEKL